MRSFLSFLVFLVGVVCCCCSWQDVSAFVPPSKVIRSTAASKTTTIQQQQFTTRHYQHHALALPPLRVALSPSSPTTTITTRDDSTTRTTVKNKVKKIPYIIEELPKQPNDLIFKEISVMCIAAFFNDGPTTNGQKGKGGGPQPRRRRTPFWKEWQLAYLRALQQSDLRRRRLYYPDSNFMLVARRVVPATRAAARRTPLILDLSQVYNLDSSSPQQDYCRGEVLGFVEVTQRPYALGGSLNNNSIMMDETTSQVKKNNFLQDYYGGGLSTTLTTSSRADRPVLTNLSVQYEARQSGVGGCLLDQCEKMVQSRWNMNEIILEVEDDNYNALRFYERRGYKVMFEDPASRRYDTNGLVLRQLRCCRKVMRKTLSSGPPPLLELPDIEFVNRSFVTKTWQRFRESIRQR